MSTDDAVARNYLERALAAEARVAELEEALGASRTAHEATAAAHLRTLKELQFAEREANFQRTRAELAHAALAGVPVAEEKNK